MNKKLKEKIHESFSSVMPITLIVLILSTTVAPMNLETLMLFLTGAVLLVIGMGFFTLGADMAMMPIGQQAGEHLTRTKKLWLIVISCFIVGIVITVAEPDLQVLARQTPAVPGFGADFDGGSRCRPVFGALFFCGFFSAGNSLPCFCCSTR